MKHKLFTHNIFLAAAVAVVFFLGSGVIFAQDWLMTKTEELKGEYGELVKKLQVTTDEDELIGILEQPGVDNEALFLKMLACKRLATHGSAKCIPALVKWLEDEKMNQYARFALEPLPGEEADEALWNATKTLKGKPLVGVIDSIAVRNNPKSDSLLNNLIMTKYARNEIDPEVAKAVTSALGYIASSETVNHFASDAKFKDVHKGFEREIADAAFHCAEIMLAKGQKEDALKIYQAIQKMDGIRDFQREAAVYHEILTLGEKGTERIVENLHSENDKLFLVAIKSVREVPQGETVTKTLLAELPKLDDPWRQSLLILALGDRCDDASKALSRAVIVEYAKTGNLVTRIAAVRAMKNLADRKSVV